MDVLIPDRGIAAGQLREAGGFQLALHGLEGELSGASSEFPGVLEHGGATGIGFQVITEFAAGAVAALERPAGLINRERVAEVAILTAGGVAQEFFGDPGTESTLERERHVLPGGFVFGAVRGRCRSPQGVGEDERGGEIARQSGRREHAADEVARSLQGDLGQERRSLAPLAAVAEGQAQGELAGLAAGEFENAVANGTVKRGGLENGARVASGFAEPEEPEGLRHFLAQL